MNNTSRYIANLYLLLLNVRDTLEFLIPRDHPINIYNARKLTLKESLKDNSAFKNFLNNNGEKGKEIEEKMNSFIDNIYGDESTILVPNGEQVRVDHTQHIQVFDHVVGINETIRDIILSYVNYARQHNESEDVIMKLIPADEALYRAVLAKLVMVDLEKSFVEFNKVMNESKGQPTPQSNFIVQNEISKLISYLRFSRQHTHLIDNKTLDLLDECLQICEMVEGRRERRDNKNFPDIFKENRQHLDAYIQEKEPIWRAAYKPVLEEMVALSKEAIENKKEQEA